MKNEVKGLVSKEVRIWKEGREQQEIDMRKIIQEQEEQHEKQIEKK